MYDVLYGVHYMSNQKTYKYIITAIDVLTNLVYKNCTSFSNLAKYLKSTRYVVAYVIYSSLSMLIVKNAKNFLQLSRKKDDTDNSAPDGLVYGYTEYMQIFSCFLLAIMVLFVFSIDFNHAFRISYRFIIEQVGISGHLIGYFCMLYSTICSFGSLFSNFCDIYQLMDATPFSDLMTNIRFILSSIKGLVESIYASLIFALPYVKTNAMLAISSFMLIFIFQLANVFFDIVMRINIGKSLGTLYQGKAPDHYVNVFMYIQYSIIFVLVLCNIIQYPIIYSVILSSFGAYIPQFLVSGIAAIITSIFTASTVVLKEDQFSNAANEYYRFLIHYRFIVNEDPDSPDSPDSSFELEFNLDDPANAYCRGNGTSVL